MSGEIKDSLWNVATKQELASGHEVTIYRWKSCFLNCHMFYIRTERERGGEREREGEAKKEKDEWMHLDSASCLVS